MYNTYFNFFRSPFENVLDQRFLFRSESHGEAIAALLYFIREKKGFALVCGDVGTGKTMIVHHVLGKLPRSVQPILIPYPDVEYIELLRYIARVLKIDPEGRDLLELTDRVKTVLAKASLDGKQVVLIVDEAHLLSTSSLEHIRLLSNLEGAEGKLLQILLIGQNELSHKLRGRQMRQLRQRINVNRFLSPLSISETIQYVDHRLRTVGSSFGKCFAPDSRRLIHALSGGVPRSINLLCDTALLICMTQRSEKVTGRILKKAHDALHSDIILAPAGQEKSKRSFGIGRFDVALAGGLLLVLSLALGVLGYRGNPGGHSKEWNHGPDSRKAVDTRVARPLPPPSGAKSEDIPPLPGAAEKNLSSIASAPEEQPPARPAPEAATVLFEKGEPASGDADQNDRANAPSPGTDETRTNDQVPARDAALSSKAELDISGSPRITHIKVKQGETLGSIAERWFPGNTRLGQKLILMANPKIIHKDRILAGQILKIPYARETD